MFDSALGPLSLPPGLPDGPGTLTFRPEAVRIGPGAANTLTAAVQDRLYLGTQTRLRLTVGDAAIEAVLAPDMVEMIAPGDTITIHLPPASLWVMPGK